MKLNPELDLELVRTLHAPVSLVWEAWTKPEHLEKWFCPKPWYVTDSVVELRPGGAFEFTMHGPDGEEFTNRGCILEVETEQKLVFTDALSQNYRPNKEPFMTAFVLFEDKGDVTEYRAIATHNDVESVKKHVEMGFHSGWGTAADQLDELLQSMK